MIFVELFVPKGVLDADRRRQVAVELGSVFELTEPQEMQKEPAEIFKRLFQVVVHETEDWVVGERLLGPDDRRRYFVRVAVPGPWRKEMSETLITDMTKVVKRADADANVQVHVTGISEGGIGLDGEVKTSTQIVELLNEPYEQDFAEGRAVKDPLCGMLIKLDETAITLEHDGTLYGFCCQDCRTAFIEKIEREERRSSAGVRVRPPDRGPGRARSHPDDREVRAQAVRHRG